MKVVLINRSDSLGGAAVASARLMRAMRHSGIDARMLVADKRGTDPNVALLGSRLAIKGCFLAERLGIFVRNGLNRDTLFKIDDASWGLNAAAHPWVRSADAIVLNWINQGTLSVAGIRRLAALRKPIVWVMHDMWNCTGVCHHAYECRRYRQMCQACPLTGAKGADLSTAVQRAKQRLYADVPIHFVAVSHWLADCCRQSSLMRDASISVIANPIDASEFEFGRRHDADVCPAGPDALVAAMGAARLDDPVKGFDLLIEATRHIAAHNPQLAKKLHIVLYGALRDELLLDQIAVPHTYLGYRSDVNRIMQNADIVLSTSRYESFGYTLAEGLASGCVPVTTGMGGQADIVKHRQNGYVSGTLSPADIAAGIEWAAGCGLGREQQHRYALHHFDGAAVAAQYSALLSGLMK